MGEAELCRLCAETRSAADLLSISDVYWSKQDLDTKILQFFQIKILPSDKLPKCVCFQCCEKVNTTWEFHEKVQQAQETLRSVITDEEDEEEEESGADYDSDQPLAPLVKTEKRDSEQNSPPVEFVECILDERTAPTNILSDVEPAAGVSRRKKKVPVRHKDNNSEKRKPGRPRGRKNRKKSVNESEEPASDSDEDNVSVLSGVSDSERNEDGSLVLRSPLESWETYPWMCVECNEKLSNMMDLRNHHQTVHNQLPKYVCVECPKIYTKYYGFISHVRCHRYHLRFCCDACNKFFPNRKLLEAHRETHYDARPYACSTCGKSFRMQSALYVHARSHLPVEVKNKYPCDQCPKRFGTKPNLMAHKRIHTGIRDYTCDQCGKSFIQKGNLDNHMLTHIAARPFSCETCGKAFKTLMRLKKHGSVHSGLKPHQCDVCGRQFRERGTLKEHHRIHTGAMPFKCEFCGKCFRFKGVLTTHRRQHTGERPYSCQECQHHFTNWPNYNKHMKRRHGINTSVTTRKPQTIPPTGMPNRNPPGTVISPSAQVLLVQDTNTVTANTGSAYVDHDPASFIPPAPGHRGQSTAGNTGPVQATSHLQSYYMLHGPYALQGMNTDSLMHVQHQ
ncbi:deformed wings [Carabus blaptoides fortunei]